MGKITIKYYGHACFKISAEAGSAVFDPYGDGTVPGLKLPEHIDADVVYCSHGHSDHNASNLVDVSYGKQPFPIEFVNVPHDDVNGAARGTSDIAFLEVEGITIAHMGDIGTLPTPELYEKLKQVDVILLPCAGFYTIDSRQALQIIGELKTPSLKILMHYRTDHSGYDVQEHISEVMKNIPGVENLDTSVIEIDPAAVENRVITLVPEQ